MGKLEKLAASLLMWECGLKQYARRIIGADGEVTPYVGVWIETTKLTPATNMPTSLLMWECGLKHLISQTSDLPDRHSLCGSVD